MKLFAKLFFFTSVILCLALSFSGYFLIRTAFSSRLSGEMERAQDSYRLTRFILQASLRSLEEEEFADALPAVLWEEENRELLLYDAEGTLLLGGSGRASARLGEEELRLLFDGAGEESSVILCRFFAREGGRYELAVAGTLRAGGERYRLVTISDGTSLFGQAREMERHFRNIYLVACYAGVLALALFAASLVFPIRRMARGAERIRAGGYSARVRVRRRDELGELAERFNEMAEAVEESVEELERSAQEKEDFVANFAHELKTPLTSVIGYADMLGSRSYPPEQTKEYAGYILKEGLRLEALSYKLMELFVLGRQDFTLEELPARDIFASIGETLIPMLREKGVRLQIRAENRLLRVEFDLFKTMLLNLVDNGIKAGAGRMRITGAAQGEHYLLEIADDGIGIPEEALGRITEAFYMVDKSRSRSQHGAGLGLALVKRIAELHGAELTFESGQGSGTTVRITLPCGEEWEAGDGEE